ncbi:hypothetical protein DFH28DRAFT_1113179 [Melampsora americana]|nr:hypothetical protein DFH28DRAFT_1113179 [Melampsora americana]
MTSVSSFLLSAINEENKIQILVDIPYDFLEACTCGFNGFYGLMGFSTVSKKDPSVIENTMVMVSMCSRRTCLGMNEVFLASCKSAVWKTTSSMPLEDNGVNTFGGIKHLRIIGQTYWYNCQANGQSASSILRFPPHHFDDKSTNDICFFQLMGLECHQKL